MMAESVARNQTVQRYLADIRQLKTLTKAEELKIARDLRAGCEDAVNRLVEGNLRFVTKVALEYRNMGLPLEDLVNEGNMGLIDAAKHFDPERDIKFITYAVWWIRRSILQALNNQIRLVRLPAWQSRKARELNEAKRQLRLELGRHPSRDELSDHLETSRKKLEQTMLQGGTEVSLDQPFRADQDRPLSETLEDQDGDRFVAAVVRRQMTDEMGKILKRLTPMQRRVLRMRFGLNGRPPMTLRQAGAEIGLTRERIRQIECQAKQKMRELFAEIHRL